MVVLLQGAADPGPLKPADAEEVLKVMPPETKLYEMSDRLPVPRGALARSWLPDVLPSPPEGPPSPFEEAPLPVQPASARAKIRLAVVVLIGFIVFSCRHMDGIDSKYSSLRRAR